MGDLKRKAKGFFKKGREFAQRKAAIRRSERFARELKQEQEDIKIIEEGRRAKKAFKRKKQVRKAREDIARARPSRFERGARVGLAISEGTQSLVFGTPVKRAPPPGATLDFFTGEFKAPPKKRPKKRKSPKRKPQAPKRRAPKRKRPRQPRPDSFSVF